MSTVTAESLLCLLSIPFLTGQIRYGVQYPANPTMHFGVPVAVFNFKDLFDETTSIASDLRYAISVWAGILGFLVVGIVILVLLLYLLQGGGKDDKKE